MVLPNFICQGVGKAGTTSLHYLMRQHPEVLLVPEKEANFFGDDTNYAKGLEWYSQKFAAHKTQRLIGDITPSYFYNTASFERIAECCGTDIKQILIFRQPVRRAFSHYLHHVRLFKTNRSFREELEGVDSLLRTASSYAERLTALLKVFPRKNVLALIHERHIVNLPAGYVQVARFLGLGVHPVNFDVHMGKACIPLVSHIETAEDVGRFPGLCGLALGDLVVETRRESDAGFVPELIKQPGAETLQWYRDFEANITRSLSPEEERDITQRLFAEDIALTRDILRDPIPEWDL